MFLSTKTRLKLSKSFLKSNWTSTHL